MLSLDKCRTSSEIIKFSKDKEMVATVKADGLSVRLVYKDGQLISAVTRGNGYEGTDVTEHVKQFLNVPLNIDCKHLIIDGEAIIKLNDFAIVNQNGEFKNPRNTAVGALNLLDVDEVKRRRLSFVAWDVIENDWAYYSDRREFASGLGFEWVPSTDVPINTDEIAINNVNEKVLEWAREAGIPCDGVVWKFNDLAYGESLGRTEKFFRNAIAYKPKDEEVETQLENIEWTMGRSGILTPVAVFKPVILNGNTISRASLHNLDILKETLGDKPYKGQLITVFLANCIIPQLKVGE
jgi:DNA ligase (NAD+)